MEKEKFDLLNIEYPKNLLCAVRGSLEADEPTELTEDVLAGIQYALSTLKDRERFVMLRRELGDEKVDKFLNAINRRCEADLIFCGSLGYQANLQNFRDPIARTFMDVDCEEYLRVHVLEGMPQREQAEKEINAFYDSLTEEQKGAWDDISSYLVSLELDLTKLAHYAGFMFANEMLVYTEPGYSPNLVLSLRYRSFMSEWFGADFKLWYEKEKMAS